MEQPINFAVAGLGLVGSRHAALIARNPEAQLAAVCDIRPGALAEAAPDVPAFSRFEEMLEAVPEIEVVTICTPNGLHVAQALAALDAGKHVVIEKPMGLSRAACETVIHRALQLSRQVFCVMQNRYSPSSIWLKQVIEQGLLGEIYLVQVNCYWNRDDRYYAASPWRGNMQLDGGVLFTQFSHFVDMLYWVFGDIGQIQGRFADFAHAHSTDFEDSGFVSFEFVNGGMGCLNYSTAVWDANLESSITVIGARGSLKIGGQYMERVLHCHIENYNLPELPEAPPANDYGAYKGSAANHTFVIQNVVDVLRGRSPISTNALEGMKVVDIIERIYALKKTPKG